MIVLLLAWGLCQGVLAFADSAASLYMPTDSGVIESQDGGKTWNKIFERHQGLARQCYCVLADQDKLLVGTGEGLFWQKKGDPQWNKVSGILGQTPIYFIKADQEYFYVANVDDLYRLAKNGEEKKKILSVASAEGIEEVSDVSGVLIPPSRFRNLEVSADPAQVKVFLKNKSLVSLDHGESWQMGHDPAVTGPQTISFDDEPNIRAVQMMAIEYANVNPLQVKRWHEQSSVKAWMPKLSVGIDRSATELYHWDTGANPDVLSRGKDYLDWSTTLSWDFGELIWNGDHTSIDLRSKLMAELRQDILDQVNRAYFQRRRLQVEMAQGALDQQKNLKIEELTAELDGLTGGEFSRHISKNNL